MIFRLIYAVIYSALIVILTGIPQAAFAVVSCQDTINPNTSIRYSDALVSFKAYNGKTYAIAKSAATGGASQAETFFDFSANITRAYTLTGDATGSLKNLLSLGQYGAARPVRIDSADTQQFILDQYGKYLGTATSSSSTYIDAWKEFGPSGFTAMDGSALSYTNWASAVYTGQEPQAAVMGADGKWTSGLDGVRTAQIVQFDGKLDCATDVSPPPSGTGTDTTPPPTGPSEPDLSKPVCGQDLNGDGYAGDSGETANCLQTAQGVFCPVGSVNCVESYSEPICPAGSTLNTSRDMCQADAVVTCGTGYAYDASIDRCVEQITCPDGGTFNPVTDQCEKLVMNECPSGYTYDSALDTCRKSANCSGGTLNPTNDRCEIPPAWDCPAGFSYSAASGKCEATPYCPAGTAYDVTRDRCEAPIGSCPAGYSFNTALNTCVASATCSGGGTLNSTDGKCELAVTINCPGGWNYDVSTGKCEQTPSCAAPGIYDSSDDLCLTPDTGTSCPVGYVYSSTYGTCIVSPSCPGGSYNPATDRCEASVSYSCSDPSYTYAAASGRCEKAPVCTQGAYNSTYNVCTLPSSPTCDTANGYTYNASTGRCEKNPECSQGTFNPVTNKCEYPQYRCSLSGTDYSDLNTCTANCSQIQQCTGQSCYPAGDYCYSMAVQSGSCNGVYCTGTCPSSCTAVTDSTIPFGAYNAGSRCTTVAPPVPLWNFAGTKYYTNYYRLDRDTCDTYVCPTSGADCNYVVTGGTQTIATLPSGTRNVSIAASGSTLNIGNATFTIPGVTLSGSGNAPFTYGCGTICLGWFSFSYTSNSITIGGVKISISGATISSPSGSPGTTQTAYTSKTVTGTGKGYSLQVGSVLFNFDFPSPPSCAAQGSCSQNTVQANPTCTNGTFDYTSHVCYATPTPSCTSGSYDPAVGQCVTAASCANGLLDTVRDVCWQSANAGCPSGYSLSGGICVAAAACASGGTLNGPIDYCASAASYSCPTGYTYGSIYGQCYAVPNCGSGSLNTFLDLCQQSITTSCPAGYTQNGDVCQQAPSCTAGGSYNGSIALCDAGSSVCSSPLALDPAVDRCYQAAGCSGGTLNAASDKCEAAAIVNCGAWTWDGSAQVCYSTPVCNLGAYNAAANECRATVTRNCGTYGWSSAQGKCTWQIDCPKDGSFSLSSTVAYSPSLDVCASDAQHDCLAGTTYTGLPVEKCEAVPICTGDGIYNTTVHGCFLGMNTCPLGTQYTCMDSNGTMQCSPNECFTAGTSGTEETTDIDESMMQDDGQRDVNGNCLDQLYVFNGKGSRCRPPGLTVGYINNCCESDSVGSDDMGSNISMVANGIQSAYEIGQVAYYSYLVGSGAATVTPLVGTASIGIVTATGSTTVSGAVAAGVSAAAASGTTGAAAIGTAMQAYVGALLNPATIAVAVVVMVVMKILMGSGCDQRDIQTGMQAASKDCHYIGEYCEKKWPLVGCVQNAKAYCCFNTKMARIIHEQGRPQLQSFGANGGWGTPTSPNCRGFTPDEFQSLDFSRIDLSEYFGDIQKGLSTKIQGAQSAIQNKVQEKLQATTGAN